LNETVRAVLAYHSRTKHHLHRFAPSPGYLDWATQPDPFRTYADTEVVELPLTADSLTAAYRDLYIRDAVPAAPLDLRSIGILFELALGLSAWKQYQQTRWALRCNPSSGNLHPTEGYAILPEMPGLSAGGVYHYASREHALERRSTLEAQHLQDLLPGSSVLIGLSSIHWREAWKYGERAFRYCQHDMGHAIATIRYAAGALGWRAVLLGDVSDLAVADILGLSRAESFQQIAEEDREQPGAILIVGPNPSPAVDIRKLRDALHTASWVGRANALSPSHVVWPEINDVTEAALRREGDAGGTTVGGENALPPLRELSSQIGVTQIIKQRRSAVALDDVTSMSAESFYAILDRLLPRRGVAPWDVWPWPPRVHCGIFVHRVRELPPGLYLFERDAGVHERLRTALNPAFVFERPSGCPEHLRLFRLVEGDFREQAQVVSCRQKIAGAGAFSLGMLADFEGSIEFMGAWWYRRLFWESGILGQVLYLEAEAAGVRGTGIGCYFDDAFHRLLGLEGTLFQSLYHFTIGGPIEDTRLMTLAGYSHLQRQNS
jgi:SagB-type dehydrogenase family enzyme